MSNIDEETPDDPVSVHLQAARQSIENLLSIVEDEKRAGNVDHAVQILDEALSHIRLAKAILWEIEHEGEVQLCLRK